MRATCLRYKQELNQLPGVTVMPPVAGSLSNRWLTALTINEKGSNVTIPQLIISLAKEYIEARSVWKPMHLQPLFKDCKYYAHHAEENISEQLFYKGICLPSGSNMTLEEQMRVIEVIKKQFSN